MVANKKLMVNTEETFPFTDEGAQAAFAKQKGGRSKGRKTS
jgi:hypothetical protein